MANKRKRGGFGFSVNLTGPGTVFTLGIIALSIGMGVLFARGPAPKAILSDPGETGDIEIVEETPDPAQKGLQLKTLKFKECASTVTIDLLLDKSTSMDEFTPSGITKLSRLIEAVLELAGNANDESIIGVQSFTTGSITNDVPISYYKDIKSTFASTIRSIQTLNATPTHDALAFSYNILKEAIPRFPPDRKFNFIFISDGAPCPGIGCPQNITPNTPDQDPRLYTPNPAAQIKELGVIVYSIGIFSQKDRAQVFVLEDLLKSIATSPDHYYAANSGDDVKRLLKEISNRICQSQVTPTPTQ